MSNPPKSLELSDNSLFDDDLDLFLYSKAYFSLLVSVPLPILPFRILADPVTLSSMIPEPSHPPPFSLLLLYSVSLGCTSLYYNDAFDASSCHSMAPHVVPTHCSVIVSLWGIDGLRHSDTSSSPRVHPHTTILLLLLDSCRSLRLLIPSTHSNNIGDSRISTLLHDTLSSLQHELSDSLRNPKHKVSFSHPVPFSLTLLPAAVGHMPSSHMAGMPSHPTPTSPLCLLTGPAWLIAALLAGIAARDWAHPHLTPISSALGITRPRIVPQVHPSASLPTPSSSTLEGGTLPTPPPLPTPHPVTWHSLCLQCVPTGGPPESHPTHRPFWDTLMAITYILACTLPELVSNSLISMLRLRYGNLPDSLNHFLFEPHRPIRIQDLLFASIAPWFGLSIAPPLPAPPHTHQSHDCSITPRHSDLTGLVVVFVSFSELSPPHQIQRLIRAPTTPTLTTMIQHTHRTRPLSHTQNAPHRFVWCKAGRSVSFTTHLTALTPIPTSSRDVDSDTLSTSHTRSSILLQCMHHAHDPTHPFSLFIPSCLWLCYHTSRTLVVSLTPHKTKCHNPTLYYTAAIQLLSLVHLIPLQHLTTLDPPHQPLRLLHRCLLFFTSSHAAHTQSTRLIASRLHTFLLGPHHLHTPLHIVIYLSLLAGPLAVLAVLPCTPTHTTPTGHPHTYLRLCLAVTIVRMALSPLAVQHTVPEAHGFAAGIAYLAASVVVPSLHSLIVNVASPIHTSTSAVPVPIPPLIRTPHTPISQPILQSPNLKPIHHCGPIAIPSPLIRRIEACLSFLRIFPYRRQPLIYPHQPHAIRMPSLFPIAARAHMPSIPDPHRGATPTPHTRTVTTHTPKRVALCLSPIPPPPPPPTYIPKTEDLTPLYGVHNVDLSVWPHTHHHIGTFLTLPPHTGTHTTPPPIESLELLWNGLGETSLHVMSLHLPPFPTRNLREIHSVLRYSVNPSRSDPAFETFFPPVPVILQLHTIMRSSSHLCPVILVPSPHDVRRPPYRPSPFPSICTSPIPPQWPSTHQFLSPPPPPKCITSPSHPRTLDERVPLEPDSPNPVSHPTTRSPTYPFTKFSLPASRFLKPQRSKSCPFCSNALPTQTSSITTSFHPSIGIPHYLLLSRQTGIPPLSLSCTRYIHDCSLYSLSSRVTQNKHFFKRNTTQISYDDSPLALDFAFSKSKQNERKKVIEMKVPHRENRPHTTPHSPPFLTQSKYIVNNFILLASWKKLSDSTLNPWNYNSHRQNYQEKVSRPLHILMPEFHPTMH